MQWLWRHHCRNCSSNLVRLQFHAQVLCGCIQELPDNRKRNTTHIHIPQNILYYYMNIKIIMATKKSFVIIVINKSGSKQLFEKRLEKRKFGSDGEKFTLPEEDGYARFDRHNAKLKCAYVIYRDLE